jgi:hypothetical protein
MKFVYFLSDSPLSFRDLTRVIISPLQYDYNLPFEREPKANLRTTTKNNFSPNFIRPVILNSVTEHPIWIIIIYSHDSMSEQRTQRIASQRVSIFLLRSCTRFIRPTLWLMLLDTTLLKTQARFILYSTRLDSTRNTKWFKFNL